MYHRQTNNKILFVLLFAVGCRFTNNKIEKPALQSTAMSSFKDIAYTKYSDYIQDNESEIYRKYFLKDYERISNEMGFESFSSVNCYKFILRLRQTNEVGYIHLGVFQIAFAKKITLDSQKTIRLEEKVRKYHNSETYIYYSTYLSKDSTKINMLFSSTHLSAPTKELFKILKSEQISDFEE